MINKRKVIHIISDANIGGGQVYVLQLIKRIKHKFHVVVICPKTGFYVEEYKKNSSNIYLLDWQMPPLCLLSTMRKILKQEQPNIIHNHLMKGCIFGSFANFRIKNNGTYNSLHGDLVPNNYSKIQFLLFSSLNYIASYLGVKYLCISEAESKILLKQGIAKEKMEVIYNGINKLSFPFSPLSYQKDNIFKVVCVARLHPAKGIFTLLDASKLLPKHIIIDIIGDGLLKQEVEERIKKEALSNVTLHGFHKDVRPFLAAAHLFVLPSNWEGFGMAIVEAMAMGKAVVSTNVGGIPEIVIPEMGGYLCPPKDTKCLSDAILKFYHQPKLIQEFGIYNRKRFEEKFSLEEMIRRLHELYNR